MRAAMLGAFNILVLLQAPFRRLLYRNEAYGRVNTVIK